MLPVGDVMATNHIQTSLDIAVRAARERLLRCEARAYYSAWGIERAVWYVLARHARYNLAKAKSKAAIRRARTRMLRRK